MNLYIRLFKTLLLFLLRPRRMELLGESVVGFRVWPGDLDTNLHMNNGRYLTLLDLGRLDFLLRTGAAAPAMRRKWYPVLGALQVRFRKPLNLFQRFEIRTRLVAWDSKWVYLEQRIISKGVLAAHAFLKGAFVGPKGTVALDELMALMASKGKGTRETSPPLPPAFAAWLEAEEGMAAASRASAP